VLALTEGELPIVNFNIKVNNIFIDSKSIQRLIAGDESVFNMTYDLYSEKVYRVAFRFLKDKEQSEEIVQETFINLWLSREKLQPEGNMWLYLFVISKRLSLTALRQISKSANLADKIFHNTAEGHNQTEEEVFARDLGLYTERMIQKLPPQQQLVFKLSRIDGLPYKMIAEQLHISPNTVKNHMVGALKTLRQHLKGSDLIYFIILASWF